jgi:hypothetical protein
LTQSHNLFGDTFRPQRSAGGQQQKQREPTYGVSSAPQYYKPSSLEYVDADGERQRAAARHAAARHARGDYRFSGAEAGPPHRTVTSSSSSMASMSSHNAQVQQLRTIGAMDRRRADDEHGRAMQLQAFAGDERQSTMSGGAAPRQWLDVRAVDAFGGGGGGGGGGGDDARLRHRARSIEEQQLVQQRRLQQLDVAPANGTGARPAYAGGRSSLAVEREFDAGVGVHTRADGFIDAAANHGANHAYGEGAPHGSVGMSRQQLIHCGLGPTTASHVRSQAGAAVVAAATQQQRLRGDARSHASSPSMSSYAQLSAEAAAAAAGPLVPQQRGKTASSAWTTTAAAANSAVAGQATAVRARQSASGGSGGGVDTVAAGRQGSDAEHRARSEAATRRHASRERAANARRARGAADTTALTAAGAVDVGVDVGDGDEAWMESAPLDDNAYAHHTTHNDASLDVQFVDDDFVEYDDVDNVATPYGHSAASRAASVMPSHTPVDTDEYGRASHSHRYLIGGGCDDDIDASEVTAHRRGGVPSRHAYLRQYNRDVAAAAAQTGARDAQDAAAEAASVAARERSQRQRTARVDFTRQQRAARDDAEAQRLADLEERRSTLFGARGVGSDAERRRRQRGVNPYAPLLASSSSSTSTTANTAATAAAKLAYDADFPQQFYQDRSPPSPTERGAAYQRLAARRAAEVTAARNSEAEAQRGARRRALAAAAQRRAVATSQRAGDEMRAATKTVSSELSHDDKWQQRLLRAQFNEQQREASSSAASLAAHRATQANPAYEDALARQRSQREAQVAVEVERRRANEQSVADQREAEMRRLHVSERPVKQQENRAPVAANILRIDGTHKPPLELHRRSAVPAATMTANQLLHAESEGRLTVLNHAALSPSRRTKEDKLLSMTKPGTIFAADDWNFDVTELPTTRSMLTDIGDVQGEAF